MSDIILQTNKTNKDNKTKKEKINRIFHISDVHISNNSSRQIEYKSVFDKLFDDLKNRNINSDTDLIMITGDTIDQADILTPLCIDLVKYFFIGLTNLCPILVTLGNHELNNYDNTLLDSLTPIIQNNFNTKNPIYMLLENANYVYKNLYVSVTLVGSKSVTECKRKKDYVNIKTYHGTIHGSTAENAYVFSNRNNFALKDFGDFDWFLLGDIHLFQYLNKAKTAWYPSSLVQKTRSEHPLDHGYILLDLQKSTTEFVRIANDYASYNLILSKDGKLNYDINDIAKYADIKITLQTTNTKHLEKVKKDILKKGINITNFIETSNLGGANIDTTIKICDRNEILTNISNDKQLVKIIMDYVKENQKLNKSKYSDIESKLFETLKNISTSIDTLKNKNIILDTLEFSNVLVFGENNKINFKNGSYYLSEPNSSGKSCLIDILSIALHSKSPRVISRGDLIRHNQLSANTKLTLFVNNVMYTITREFKRKNITSHPIETIVLEKGGKVIFDLTKTKSNVKNDESDNDDNDDNYDNDNQINNLTKERDRDKIRDIIEKEIISYDDLFLCSIVSQTKKINFLTADNKRDLLLRYSGLSIFSDISQYSAKKCGELTRQLGLLYNDKCFDKFRAKTQKRTKDNTVSFKDTDMENIKKQLEKDKKEHDDQIENFNKEYDELEKSYSETEKTKIKLEESLKIYNSLNNLNDKLKKINDADEINTENTNLNKKLESVLATINDLEDEKQTLEINIKTLTKEIKKYKNINDELESFNNDKKNKTKKIQTELNTLNMSLLKTNIKNTMSNSNCKTEIKTIKKELVDLENKICDIKEKITSIEELINICNDNENILELYKEYAILKCMLEIDTEKLKLYNSNTEVCNKKQITDLKLLIKTNTELIKSKEINKINFDKYKGAKSVKNLSIDLKEHKKEEETLIKKQFDLKNKIENLENYLSNKTIKEQISELETELQTIEESTFEKYNEYAKLSTNLAKEEKELNSVLLSIEKQNGLKQTTQTKIDQNMITLNEYNANKKLLTSYKKDKKEFDSLEKKYNEIKDKFNKQKKLREQKIIEDKQHFANYQIAQTNYDKYIKIKDDKDSYSIINNLLMKNGLIDSILKDKVLVKLEQTTNTILKSINHNPISIKMIDKKGNKYKNNEVIITNLDGTIAGNCGYFERNVMELAIRMATSQINNFVKINTVFVDECFDGASKENYTKIIKLIEHFKDYYLFNLVVSHDEKLITLFDKRIRIVKPVNKEDIKKNGYRIQQ